MSECIDCKKKVVIFKLNTERCKKCYTKLMREFADNCFVKGWDACAKKYTKYLTNQTTQKGGKIILKKNEGSML